MTTVYLDTSAAVKLFMAEAESAELRRWFGDLAEPRLLSSALLRVELLRVLGFAAPGSVSAAERFIADHVDIVEITPPIMDDAATVPPTRLRTLDALHLATALDLADTVDVLCSYDKLLLDAAQNAGLDVAAPGV